MDSNSMTRFQKATIRLYFMYSLLIKNKNTPIKCLQNMVFHNEFIGTLLKYVFSVT